MKKFLLLIQSFLLSVLFLQAQVAPPQAFSFKATIISKSGAIVASKPVSLRISILRNNMQGIAVYSEIFYVKTSEYGQVDLLIGKGNPEIGNFASIQWSDDDYFLKTEVDVKGGTEFIPMSTVQLLSVPYSLLSDKSNYAFSTDEKDPVFSAHPANQISPGDISNWNEAAAPNPAKDITKSDITNWNTAFNWEDHSKAGYAISDSVYTKSDLQTAGRSEVNWDNLGNRPELAPVALTGKYSDLRDVPGIPDNLNQLTPDAGNRKITNVSEPIDPSDASTKAYVDALLGRIIALEEFAGSLSGNQGNTALLTKDVVSITTTSATGGGNIIFDGNTAITLRGLCWSTEANPAIYNDTTQNGSGKGSFTGHLTGLEPGRTYYLRAYAVNESGTSYGNEKIFRTLIPPPVIAIDTVSSVSEGSATIGGTITGSTSNYEHGVCWNISPNPTTENNKIINDSDSGSYQVNISGLAPNTTYYARSYAIVPPDTIYGDEVSFTTPESITGTATDSEGNIYSTIKIGSQTWFAENLKVTKYSNGDPIANITGADWSAQKSGAYCWYNNEPSNKGLYGALYNWYAVADPRNICPSGWHEPTNGEWTVLIMNIGGEAVAGGKLKEAGLNHWITPNNGATNETGFTALPGGTRNLNAVFSPSGTNGILWSATEADSVSAYFLALTNTLAAGPVVRNPKAIGMAVRCIKGDAAPGRLPEVTTADVTNITSNTATTGGTVISDGGESVVVRGVCYNILPNPTISHGRTVNGGGTGDFVSTMTNLQPGKTIYVRAYATNAAGTAYGNEISFTTLPGLASVGTVNVTVTDTSATLQSSVGYDGGSPVTERGFCWSATSNPPTISDSIILADARSGSFTGTITGLEPGMQYWVRAYAKNSSGIAYGIVKNFRTLVPPPKTSIYLNTNFPGSVTSESAVSGSKVDNSDYPIIERGICWSTSPSPSVYDNKVKDDNIELGRNTSTISGLSPNTIYFVRAYCINTIETAYGNEVKFITKPLFQTVFTGQVSAVTATSAMAGGNITNDGGFPILERGICYSITPEPLITDRKTSCGTGTGTFTCNLTGLNPSANYFYRAYAINSAGTYYGDMLSFSPQDPTLPGIVSISTTEVNSITSTTAIGGGNITDAGGNTILSRGVCWSTSIHPTCFQPDTVQCSTVTNNFSCRISRLMPGTQYFVRAFVRTEQGIFYGNELLFTTLNGPFTVPNISTIRGQITTTSAWFSGSVADDEGHLISERGLCWSTSPKDTLINKIVMGADTGWFNHSLTGLATDTRYYAKTYAIKNNRVFYGNTVCFVTGDNPTSTPVVFTNHIAPESTGAIVTGYIQADGGIPVTESGICWNDTSNPLISDYKISVSTVTGSFTANITGLIPGKTYSVRSYAINSLGIGYGNIKTIKVP